MMKDVVCYGTAKYAQGARDVGGRQDRHGAVEAAPNGPDPGRGASTSGALMPRL